MTKNLNGRLVQLVDELVEKGLTLHQGTREFEKQYILATLRQNDGNLTRAAKSLGVHRNTLRNKVGNLGIAQADYLASSAKRRSRRRPIAH
ncbi:MAG: helix-turn-helix domain-containing protein [Acidobacteriota bacterium]|nr:helix-turn-helix domain-containing protein [Acidobacteriota bacterium]